MIKAGFDQASQDFDTDAKEVVTLADMEQKMAELAEQGTDLIIASIDLLGFVESVAADHPDTQFAVLDSVLASGPNIAGAEFDNQGLAYLAGVTAALTTETDVVGILLGVQNPFMEDFARGYEAGVASIDEDITVLLDFVSAAVVPNNTSGLRPDGFERPDEAYAEAMHMYVGGADVIFSAAGSSGYGSIEAAASYSEEHGTHVWAIGVDYDEGFLSGSAVGQYVLTSMIKRYDEATYRMIEAYLDGTLESTMHFGFENGGLSYSTYGGHVDDVTPELDDVIEALADNEILIPSMVTTRPAWHAEADDSIVVTFDGETCRASRPPQVGPGQTLNVTAVNTTPLPVVMGIGYAPTDGMGDVISGFAWTVAPGSSYDIRAVMVGNPRLGVAVGCFTDGTTVLATEVFPVVEG
jgi:basic membrane protein A